VWKNFATISIELEFNCSQSNEFVTAKFVATQCTKNERKITIASVFNVRMNSLAGYNYYCWSTCSATFNNVFYEDTDLKHRNCESRFTHQSQLDSRISKEDKLRLRWRLSVAR